MNGGGGGSRTRVLRSFHAGFYKFSRKLYVFSGGFGIRPPHSGTPPEVSLKWWRTTSTEPGLDHTLNPRPRPTWLSAPASIRQRELRWRECSLRCLQLTFLMVVFTWPRSSPTTCYLSLPLAIEFRNTPTNGRKLRLIRFPERYKR